MSIKYYWDNTTGCKRVCYSCRLRFTKFENGNLSKAFFNGKRLRIHIGGQSIGNIRVN